MNNQDSQIINRYLSRLKNSEPNINGVYFFGSRAKGTGHKWSDYDVCIVSPNYGKDRIAEMTKLMLIASDMNENIEPHPMSIEEFNDPNNDLANEIRRTGVRIL
ncbi:nucleotidyltransferase domain-containing protein [Candidatus Collierbacteria bacterium]|nr:nucleotidyltransferase domain-containing protein [Candidatus Collierbacteria bacterium]